MKTKFAIWYMRPGWFRTGMMMSMIGGVAGSGPSPKDLTKTHIHLMDVELEHAASTTLCEQLERIFHRMQGEIWSPNGEARGLIRSKGLSHTSMSVGDVVVVNDETYIVASFGFEKIEEETTS